MAFDYCKRKLSGSKLLLNGFKPISNNQNRNQPQILPFLRAKAWNQNEIGDRARDVFFPSSLFKFSFFYILLLTFNPFFN
jgi:hypothetical protein